VAYSRDKLALHTRLRNLNLKSQFSIFDSFRSIRVHIYEFLKFLSQSMGTHGTNTFQLKFFSSMKFVGTTGLGGLWALEWGWQIFLG